MRRSAMSRSPGVTHKPVQPNPSASDRLDWAASPKKNTTSFNDHPLAGANPLPPDLMTPEQRLDEVARLLALGILRLRARRRAERANDPNHLRRFGLDFRGEGSLGDTDAHDRRDAA